MLIASNFPAWFAYWFLFCNTVPFLPPTIAAIYFASRSSKLNAAQLQVRLRWLAVAWVIAMLISITFWQPYVMNW